MNDPVRERRTVGLGPGVLVTAAFIGPGTVTTALLAGVSYDLRLLWVVAVSTLAAIVLQEMAGRVGLAADAPLGEVLVRQAGAPAARWALLGLIFLAILFGNAAYQTGNLLGAAKGAQMLASAAGWPNAGLAPLATVLALAAATLLSTGNPRLVTAVLTGLVLVMSVLFLGLAGRVLWQQPTILGTLPPAAPGDATAQVLALFGTTIVPYNLFLYASAVRGRWSDRKELADRVACCRRDIALAVGLGGLVTAAIVMVGAAADASPRGLGLEQAPAALSGLVDARVSQLLLGAGLCAAGLTSAVTAPLAASHAAAGLFGFADRPRSAAFRVVWAAVLLSGWSFAVSLQQAPEQAIVLAQAANALVLPLLAVLLWRATSRRDVVGESVNRGPAQAVIALAVAAVLLAWLLLVRRWWTG